MLSHARCRDSKKTNLAVVEVRIALSVENHSVVAHHKEIAAHVVQRQEGTRHDALSDQREIHRLLDHLVSGKSRTVVQP